MTFMLFLLLYCKQERIMLFLPCFFQENTCYHYLITGIPERPQDVTVRCHGNTAEVSWRPGQPNGAETSSYLVQYNLIMENPDEWFSYYEDTLGSVTVAYIELAPYGDYSFRVIARNRFGSSIPSKPTAETCTTPPDRPDRNPRHVRSRTDKKGFLVIEWEVTTCFIDTSKF